MELLGPRQLVDAERRYAFCERERRRFIGRDRCRRILEKQRAEPALAPAAKRARRGVERQIIAKLDVRGEFGFDLASLDRCGEQNTRGGGTPGDLGDGEKGCSRHRIGRVERRRTAVGEKILAVAAARLGEAFRIGKREQKAR